MTTLKLDDFCDSTVSHMDTPDAVTDAFATQAIAQMLVCDGLHVVLDDKQLRTPCQALGQRSFGRNLRLCPDAESELTPYVNEYCVVGSTAVLIGPKHVLTVAHSIERGHIQSHVFVFGRTADDPAFVYDQGVCRIPRARVAVAQHLVAYVDLDSEADWAVLELFEEVRNIEPLRVGRYVPTRTAVVLGHPLGLPIKRATTKPITRELPTTPNYALLADNGQGGSGSAILQDGLLVGLLRGEVEAADTWAQAGTDGPCINFAKPGCERAQPFTPTQLFAPTLPSVFGW